MEFQLVTDYASDVTPRYSVRCERNARMQARDGTDLRADVYRPNASGRFPVLVLRTPYGRETQGGPGTEAAFFAPHGYVVVVQDTRGRGGSGGEFYPFMHEGRDTYDAIEWAAQLPWSNGKVGTVGQSYSGLTQLLGAAEGPPHLRAASPVSGPVSMFENFAYRRGAFELGWVLPYTLRLLYGRDGLERSSMLREASDFAIPVLTDEASRRPLLDLAEELVSEAPFLKDFILHNTEDDYWRALDIRPRLNSIDVPMFHVTSWYDAFQFDGLTTFSGMAASAPSERTRRAQRLLVGPWTHLLPYSVPTSGGTGNVDHGEAAKIELFKALLPWFDAQLKEPQPGAPPAATEDAAPVRIFVMGKNEWRDESEWPLRRAVYTDMYLRSDGRANSRSGDGELTFQTPTSVEPCDEYTYDPANPVPTCGGALLGASAGVQDQSSIDGRADVLVYVSDALDRPLEVTGPVRLVLHASSSACDTDFTAKLVDVQPDGFARNVVDGVVRARFRDSLTDPSLLVPGQVYAFDIDLWSTSHVFAPGHRIRLDVSSSNFPRFDRNPNTGQPLGDVAAMKPARQRVFHGIAQPSHLILPLIKS